MYIMHSSNDHILRLVIHFVALLLTAIGVLRQCTVNGVFIPSVQFQRCDLGTNITSACRSIIAVQGITPIRGDGYSFSFTIDQSTQISDGSGRPYAPETPILVEVDTSPLTFKYDITQRGYLFNTYATKKALPASSQCPPSSLCCNGMQYGLENNATKYTYYSLDYVPMKQYFDIFVRVYQNTVSDVLRLNQDVLIAESQAVKAQVTHNLIQANYRLNNPGRVLVHESVYANPNLGNYVPEPFFVPNTALYPHMRTNTIGMQMTSDLVCSKDFEKQVSVEGGSIYDQFSSFRKTTLRSMSNLNGMEMEVGAVAAMENSGQLSLMFRDQVSIMLYFELEAANNFKLIRLFGQPHVVDSGLLPYTPGDINIVMFIDIMNIDNSYKGDFLLEPKTCCSSSVCTLQDEALRIEKKKSQTIKASSTERIKFLIVATEIIGKTGGYCYVDISQHGTVDLTTRVDFVLTTKTPLESGSTPLESDACTGEANIMYVREGRRYCRPPCLGEKLWDPDKGLCIAPNCVAAYEGYRNYWNENTGFCEAISICTNGTQEYNPFTNQCDEIPWPSSGGSGGNETGSGGSSGGSSGSGTTQPKSEQDALAGIAKPDCGAHGTVSASGETCICNSGYFTDWTQTNNIQWCNKQAQKTAENTPSGSSSGSGNHTSGSSSSSIASSLSALPLYMKVIGGLSIGFIILSVVGILILIIVCLIKRRRNRKAEAEKKTKKRKRELRKKALEDDEESIVDWDDVSLITPPKKKSKNRRRYEKDEELTQLERLEERDLELRNEVVQLRAQVERQKKRRQLSPEEKLHLQLKVHKKKRPPIPTSPRSGNDLL